MVGRWGLSSVEMMVVWMVDCWVALLDVLMVVKSAV